MRPRRSLSSLPASIEGGSSTKVSSPAQLKGKWTITFAEGGVYTVTLNGETMARGRHTSTATTVTLDREQGSPCKGVGTYGWKRSGNTVTFTGKKESASCQARAIVLSHRFTRVR